MFIEYNEKEMFYMGEKIDEIRETLFAHLCVGDVWNYILRKCNRANAVKSRSDIVPAETFLFPECVTPFSGGATPEVRPPL